MALRPKQCDQHLVHSERRSGTLATSRVEIFRSNIVGRKDNTIGFPALAADLVARRVALIASGAGEPAAFAAKGATSTIPIVMVLGGDPVTEGLVASLSRPGSNITGATLFAYEMESKRLGLLHEAVPSAKNIAVLVNPGNPNIELQLRDVRETAPRLGVEVIVFKASAEDQFDGIFADMAQRQVGALLVAGDPYFFSRHAGLITLAAQHRIPAIYEWREIALEGGLMSYGTGADRRLQSSGYLRQPHPQRREAGRPSVCAADQLPIRYQPQDCEGARVGNFTHVVRARRRGDRMRRWTTSYPRSGDSGHKSIRAHAERRNATMTE